MASNMARTCRGGMWLGLLLAPLLGALGQPPQTRGQPGTPPPPRPRLLLATGFDLFKNGDYEMAAQYYAAAQKGQDDLTPRERADLKTLIERNHVALQHRRNGAMQVRKAEEALRQNRLTEANNLIRLADHQYLAPADRQVLQSVQEKIRAAGAKPHPNETVKGDYKSLVGAARAALNRGEVDAADYYAAQAEKVGRPWWLPLWNDTHTKVKRDSQALRATLPPREPMPPPMTDKKAPEKKDSTGPLQGIKNIFIRPKHEDKIKQTGANDGPPLPPPPPPVDRGPPGEASSPLQTLKQVVTWPANLWAKDPKTEDAKPNGPPRAQRDGPPPAQWPAAEPAPVPPPPNPTLTQQNTLKARQLVRQGYLALRANDLESARRLALQAQGLRPDMTYQDADNPGRLLAEIQRRTATAAGQPPRPPELRPDPTGTGQRPHVPDPAKNNLIAKVPEPAKGLPPKPPPARPGTASGGRQPPGADGRALLREARARFRDNKLDLAEELCIQAATTNIRWGLFEDNPDKLRTDLSNRLLVEARQRFTKGQYQEAKSLAYRAQQLHGPYSVWDFGDRPQKLLAEIDRKHKQDTLTPPDADAGALAQNQKPLGPAAVGQAFQPDGGPDNRLKPGLQQAASGTPPGPPPLPPELLAKKTRAYTLLAEARALERQGRLIEARNKAIEADQVGYQFGLGEDQPKIALANLAEQCSRFIQGYVQRASESAGASGDPDHFGRAAADLAAARQLAGAFGMDASLIDQREAQIRRAGGVNPPVMQGPPPQLASLGQPKLDAARRELRAGNSAGARKIAEELAADAGLGLQKEAFDLLRSIEVEERLQATLAANRTAEAVIDAYRQRDYRRARTILATLHRDWPLVGPQLQATLRNIAAEKEMQPEAVAQAETQKLHPAPIKQIEAPLPGKIGDPGRAQVTDLGPLALNNKISDPLEQRKALEEVQFDRLRQLGLNAHRSANDLFGRGELRQALDVLTNYLDQLEPRKNPELDEDRLALLRRPIKMKVHNLRTAKAAIDLEKETRLLGQGGHDERARNRAIAKQQEDLVRLGKQLQVFVKENKYEEAKSLALQMQALDPDNLAAQVALFAINIKRTEDISKKDEMEKDGIIWNEGRMRFGPYVNMDNPIRLDKNTLDRAIKRPDGSKGISFNNRNPIERAIEHKLNLPIHVTFRDATLQKAIDDLKMLTGVNIVPDYAALKDAGISLDSRLSMPAEGISLKSALNILLKQVRLTYLIKDEVLQITTHEEAQGKTKQVTYPVADLVIPIDNHPVSDVNSFEAAMRRHIQSTNGNNYGAAPYPGPYGLANGQPVSAPASGLPGYGPPGQHSGMQTNVVKRGPSNTIEDVLINLITNTIRPNSWKDVGGQGTIQYYPLGMALVINQQQEVQEEVLQLLQALRKLQDLEVAIELRLVSVSESFFERLGLDFDITFLTNNKRYEPLLLNGQFQPPGYINQFRPGNFIAGLLPTGQFTPDLNIPLRGSSFDFSLPPFGGYPGTLGADGGISLGLAFLSDIQVQMFLAAAEGDRRTSLMQAPKITVFNGQTATISVQDQIFFLTSINIQQTGVGNTFFSPQNQPFPIGTTLTVTPVISADRRFVRLNMTPSLTNLVSATVPLIPVQIPLQQLYYGPGTGSTQAPPELIFQMFFQQPSFSQITVNTTVNVPDGGTVLMGGLKYLAESRNEFGPPVLSKIPYLSRLFKNIGYGREANSLMIMVSPRIIIQEEEELIFRGELPPIPRP